MDIELKLSINRGVICSNSIIGKTYENKATRLIFELPDEMINKWFYIEFELPDGTKISTEKLEILDNKVIYEIPNNLLESQGKLKLEVVLRNADNLVWRSYTQTFNIINSINATEYIEEEYKDFITESQKVIDLVELNGDGYSYLSNDGTYKRVEAVVTDYNNLSNQPIVRISGTENDPIYLRDLQTGTFILSGVCKPFNGSDESMTANSAITFVNHFDAVTAIQIFYPPYNQIQYFEVYDNTYTSKVVALNNMADKLANIEDGANKYTLPEATADTLGGVKVGSGLEINNGVLSATATGTGNVSSDTINSIVVVDSLPDVEEEGVLYLVKE